MLHQTQHNQSITCYCTMLFILLCMSLFLHCGPGHPTYVVEEKTQTKVKLITCSREKLDNLTHTIHVVVAKFKTPTLLALDKKHIVGSVS